MLCEGRPAHLRRRVSRLCCHAERRDVDVKNGVIHRYSPRRQDRLWSYALVLIALVVAGGIVAGAAYLPVNGWPLEHGDLTTLLVGWVAVWAGVIVHVAVSTTKRLQAQRGRPPTIALGDLPLLINAKIGYILLKVLLSVLAILGVALGVGPVPASSGGFATRARGSVVE